MSLLTTDSAMEFLTGTSVHSIPAVRDKLNKTSSNNTDLAHLVAFCDAVNRAEKRLGARLRMSELWPLAEFWEDKTAKEMQVIRAFLKPLISKAFERTGGTKTGVKAPKEIQEGETLVDHLVKCTRGVGLYLQITREYRHLLIIWR